MSEQIESLQQSLSADPSNWETRFGLIYALHQEGRTHEAVDLLSEITELPADDRSIVYAAQCYQVLGANEQAQSVYETALSMNPANEPARAGLRSLGVEPEINVPTLKAVPVEEVEAVAVQVAEPDAGSRTVALEDASKAVRSRKSTPSGGTAAPAPVISKDDTIPYDPETANFVDHIHEAEEESKRRYQAAVARDRINSVIVTVLVHVAIVIALGLVIQKVPRRVPPQIVASSSAETNEPALEKQVMKKSSLKSANPSEASAANIISVPSVSAISMTSMDSFTGSEMPVETGMTFQPSMSMGMPSSSNSMMMFGQPLEGETLGVILDLSASMAEWLPLVIKEVDRNFDDAPIVYIRSPEIKKSKENIEVRPVVKEEVVRARKEDGTWTPFTFLWNDLPRKAPQRSVDRLIETMRTRVNQFITVDEKGHVHRGDLLGAAMKFLAKEGCDAIYIFSDFANSVDEEQALEHARSMAQQKVRVYIQPPVEDGKFIKVAEQKIANRTKGRLLPTLDSVINPESTDPKPLIVERPTEGMPEVPGVTYARPRTELVDNERHTYRPNKGWKEITRYSQPEFDAVFYGPEARALIFLKDNDGKYIQRPIEFYYHSRKELPDHPDTAHRWRRRKFLRLAEDPTFVDNSITWKMILEDELKFDVYLYFDRRGMNATYTADIPKDGTEDHTHVSFRIPTLAIEYQDMYYGQDCPEGLDLDTVRVYAHPNEVEFNLPRQDRDQYAEEWARHGFEPGYNIRKFDTLITRYPYGVRSIKVSGPSFGPRVIKGRTTSSKLLLGTWGRHWGGDSEPWEGMAFHIHRAKDKRHRFTKTEAVAIEIE